MNLSYSNAKEESEFSVTDFNCASSQKLLKKKGNYKIIWARGEGVDLVVDGYNIHLEQHQVIFCTPLNVIEIQPKVNEIVSFVFNREFYCIRDHDEEVSCNGFLFFGSAQPPVISLAVKEQESFSAMYLIFTEEFETRDHIQGEMLRSLLKRVLIKSSRMIKKGIPSPDMASDKLDVIRKFNILVEQNFKTMHQVSEYAAALNKSPKTLSNLFKKYNDKTPLKTINERILLEAKRLLLFSNKTAEEIAFDLGYSESPHFSKFFKNNIGHSPIEFKKLHRVKEV